MQLSWVGVSPSAAVIKACCWMETVTLFSVCTVSSLSHISSKKASALRSLSCIYRESHHHGNTFYTLLTFHVLPKSCSADVERVCWCNNNNTRCPSWDLKASCIVVVVVVVISISFTVAANRKCRFFKNSFNPVSQKTKH